MVGCVGVTFELACRQADGFLQQAAAIAQVRDDLSPDTWLSCDEMGVILGHDNDADAVVPPTIYYNSVGAMYAYLVPQATKLGIEVRVTACHRLSPL